MSKTSAKTAVRWYARIATCAFTVWLVLVAYKLVIWAGHFVPYIVHSVTHTITHAIPVLG
jgi:hypothetical protein